MIAEAQARRRRSNCASRFERSFSSRYVTVSPEAAMTYADLVRPFERVFTWPHSRSSLERGPLNDGHRQNVVMTLRMTSPASIARNASFTSSSLIVRDTIAAVSRRPVSMRSAKRWKSRRT